MKKLLMRCTAAALGILFSIAALIVQLVIYIVIPLALLGFFLLGLWYFIKLITSYYA